MIDFRYHLTSIVAVFLALGLGMLIGALLADEGALAQEYARLIEQIEAGLERTRQNNRRLAAGLAEAERRLDLERGFVEDVLGELLQGKLEGLSVELVAETPDTAAERRIRAALRGAGASLLPVDFGASPDGRTGVPPLTVVVRESEAGVGSGSEGELTVTGIDGPRGLFALIELLEAAKDGRPAAAEEAHR